MAVNAKARVAQLTGSRSITAAAEDLVTFGYGFYWWRARLLSGWGSSLAQGIGGRVRTPAPTAGRLQICRRGRSQTGPPGKENTAGGAHPRVASLAPSGQFTFSPSPTHNKKVVQVWVGEPLGLPPHPSGLTASHLPLKGKALKTRSSAFPFRGRCPRRGRMRYPCFELGMLARQTQAREWNRASSNFRKPRAQWPGGNLECHSDFARWKYSAHSKG